MEVQFPRDQIPREISQTPRMPVHFRARDRVFLYPKIQDLDSAQQCERPFRILSATKLEIKYKEETTR